MTNEPSKSDTLCTELPHCERSVSVPSDRASAGGCTREVKQPLSAQQQQGLVAMHLLSLKRSRVSSPGAESKRGQPCPPEGERTLSVAAYEQASVSATEQSGEGMAEGQPVPAFRRSLRCEQQSGLEGPLTPSTRRAATNRGVVRNRDAKSSKGWDEVGL